MPPLRLDRVRLGVQLVLLGCAVLLWARVQEPLWYDEAWPVEDLVGAGAPHPGYERFFLGLLRAWIATVGLSLESLRALSGLCGLVALWITSRAARAAGGDPLTAAMVLGGLPLALRYWSELNRYAPLLLLSAVSLSALLAAGRAPGLRAHVLVAASGALAFFVHHTAAFSVLLVQSVVLLAQRMGAPPGERRARTVALLLVPLAQLGLLGLELPQLLEQARIFGEQQKDAYTHVYSQASTAALASVLGEWSPGRGQGPLAVACGGVLLGALAIGGAARPGAGRRELILLGCGPVAGAALGSLLQPMFVARVLLPAAPALAVVASRAWPDRPRLRRGLAWTALALGWCSAARATWPEDARGALALIAAESPRPGEGLVVQPPFARSTLRANQRVLRLNLPLTELEVDAPTPLQAARWPWAHFPARVFVVLQDFRGFDRPLAQELPLHFARVRSLGRVTAFEVLLCEQPLALEDALARADAPGDPPALRAFRRGSVLLHAGQPGPALEAFRAARDALRQAPASDPRQARDDAGQAAWAVAWSAHQAGRPEEAREALREAEALGTAPAWARAAIGGGPPAPR